MAESSYDFAFERLAANPSFIVEGKSNSNDDFSLEDSSSSYYDHQQCHHYQDLCYPRKSMHDNSANSSHVTAATQDVTEISSDDSSDHGLEVSAVNTHTSIFNISEDFEDEEDEFDEEGRNFLFPDEEPTDSYLDSSILLAVADDEDFDDDFPPESTYQEPQDYSLVKQQTPCCKETSTCLEQHPSEPLLCTAAPPANHPSLLDQIDTFFERLCFSKNEDTNVFQCSPRHDCLESVDFLHILGCLHPPTNSELEFFLSTQNLLVTLLCQQPRARERASKSRGTRRLLAKNRRARVNQLLSEQGRAIPTAPSLRTVRSMEEGTCKAPHTAPSSSSVELWFGMVKRKVSLSQPEDDNCDGYDSDPGIPYNKPTQQQPISPRSVAHIDSDWQDCMYQTVQESMNSSWNLTWLRQGKPVNVQVWIERGTLIKNNAVMVEPRLMWRPTTRSRPETVRLLHIFRVRPCTAIDRAPHPLARASTSFVVRTTPNNDTIVQTTDHVFQAVTVEERDAVVRQWKMTIARFAALAVLGDAALLLHEFFVTNPTEDETVRV